MVNGHPAPSGWFLENTAKIYFLVCNEIMVQRIYDAIEAAKHDSAQIPGVAHLAREVVEWGDFEVDQLLQQLTQLGDDLRASETSAIGFPHAFHPASNADQRQENCLELALQPVIHHLVAREANRIRNVHRSRTEPDAITNRPSTGSPDLQLAESSPSSPESKESPSEEVAAKAPPTHPPTMPLSSSVWSQARFDAVESLYRSAPPASNLRNHLLRWLSTAGGKPHLDLWLALICHDPPEHRMGIGLAFAPLMQSTFTPTRELLNELLHRGTSYSQIAPAIFDYFNFCVRHKKLKEHPARLRLDPLTDLLGQLCGQLARIEGGNFQKGLQASEINQLVSDSVALIVALCDTFALTNHDAAIPQLRQALQLRHRRVQTEAAAALARMNDDAGKKALVHLAEQPVARLRVLAYAEELGFKNAISLELQGEIAIAESKLAIWLSEPEQMGLAPSHLELVDQRRMYWPSYDDPVTCFLFKYSYGTGEQAYSNIGICGPLTYAFAADLRHLPIDEIYAAFAGWQTTHEEIFQMSLPKARQVYPNEIRKLQRLLEAEPFEDLAIQSVGSFFGELILIATAIYEGKEGTLIVDSLDSTWFERGNPDAPVDWKLAYGIWRGKQLLSRFNSEESE